MIKSLTAQLIPVYNRRGWLWRATAVDHHAFTAVLVLGIMSSVPLMQVAVLDGKYGLLALAGLTLALLVLWAIRNWEDIRTENIYLASFLTPLIAGGMVIGMLALTTFLGGLPITYSGPGTISRASYVRSFVDLVQERSGQVPEVILRGSKPNATQRELFEANQLRQGLIYGKKLDRALLAMRLLKLDQDERYVQAKSQGWMDNQVLVGWGKTLVEHPPLERMDGNPVYQQAYLFMVGEQDLAKPFGSENK